MKSIHECDYCSFTSSNAKKCKEHETSCNSNPKNYRLEVRKCDSNCWFAKSKMCNYMEHCNETYTVKISTITGKEIE